MRKGQQTRERLLDAAARLFAEHGFDGTTMRAIATEAGRSPGLTYRYFASKEALVLGLYERIARELAEAPLPDGPVGMRFEAAMRAKLVAVAPVRQALGRILALMLDPAHQVGVFGEAAREVRRQNQAVFARVAAEASPKAPQLGEALYLVHLGLLLLSFQSEAAADEALEWARDMLLLLPPDHPLLALGLARLQRIVTALEA